MVTGMEVNKSNTLLISADSFGFIYAWNIDGFCMEHVEEGSPECKYAINVHVCLNLYICACLCAHTCTHKIIQISIHCNGMLFTNIQYVPACSAKHLAWPRGEYHLPAAGWRTENHYFFFIGLYGQALDIRGRICW